MSSVIKVNTIQDSGGNAIITSDGSGNVTTQNVADVTPAFNVTLGTTQTLSTGTWTKLQLDTETYDTDNAFDSTTNYRFTVPTGEGGKYLFNYSLGTNSLTSSTHGAIRLYKNGSAVDGSFTRSYPNQTTGAYPHKTMVLTLVATDYIELYGQHNKGSDADISTSDTFLSGHKLIGI